MENEDEDPVVSANLRKLMNDAGIGGIGALRQAMAERGIKIGAGTIQRALQGGGRNRVDTLGKLASFFDVTTDQLLQADLGLDEPAELVGPPPPPGDKYEALDADEQRLVDAFREFWDEEERRELLEEITSRAMKSRTQREKILAPYGIKLPPVKHAADEKKAVIARAALEVSDRLRQESLFEPTTKPTDKKH